MSTLHELSTKNPAGFRDVHPTDVARARSGERIVDVREPHELTGELGHVAGSENVPLGAVERAAPAWPKDQPIGLVCRAGARSAKAAGILVAAGFSSVMNMSGGMIAWNEAGLPVAR